MPGHRGRSLFRFVSLVLLCCFLVVSCSRSNPELNTSSSDRSRIVLGTTSAISTLDPADAYATFTGTLLYNLGDRLYTYKLGTNELEPQLAAAFPKISSDGLTYTIPLRQGVVFHDGTPFNAKAMAFSLNRFIKNGGAPSFLLSDLLASAEPTNEYELSIKLKRPFAAFPSLLAFSGACAVSPKPMKSRKAHSNPRNLLERVRINW